MLTSEGVPLGELKTLSQLVIPPNQIGAVKLASLDSVLRAPAGITFVRNRMLYARAALNGNGGIRFGLRHIRKSHIVIWV